MSQHNKINIRPYQIDDAEAFCACITSSLKNFSRYLPWVYPNYSIDHAQQWVEQAIIAWQSGYQYDFVIESEGRILGGVGILNINPLNKSGFLGYFVRDDAGRKGVATEAALLAIHFARDSLGLKLLYLDVAFCNTASHRIAEKLSAKYLETLPQYELVDGEYVDAKRYFIEL